MAKSKSQPGRASETEHFTKMHRHTMACPAWKALSTVGQALYPHLKLEWKGPRANNNGKISLSTRQAAEKMGVSINTAARAFQDLQAKGFIVVTRLAVLGLAGDAKVPQFEITELGLPGQNTPTKKFLKWKVGHDFQIIQSRSNNPAGKNGRKNLSSK